MADATPTTTFDQLVRIKILRPDAYPSDVLDLLTTIGANYFKDNEPFDLALAKILYHATDSPIIDITTSKKTYVFHLFPVNLKNWQQNLYGADVIVFLAKIAQSLGYYEKTSEELNKIDNPFVRDFVSKTAEIAELQGENVTLEEFNRTNKYSYQPSDETLSQIAQFFQKPYTFEVAAKIAEEQAEEKKVEEEQEKKAAAVPIQATEEATEETAEGESEEEQPPEERPPLDQAQVHSTQAAYVEGFTQLTVASLMAQVGINNLDDLPPEIKSELFASARGQIASYILSLSPEELNALARGDQNARFVLLRNLHHALTLAPGFTYYLQAAINHQYANKPNEAAQLLNQFTHNQQKQTYEQNLAAFANNSNNFKTENFKQAFLKLGFSEEQFGQLEQQDFFAQLAASQSDPAQNLLTFDAGYQNRLLSQFWDLATNIDPGQQTLVGNNLLNTLDSFIIQGMSPDFILLMSAGQLNLLFVGPNAADFATEANLQSLRQLLYQFWLFRRIDLARKSGDQFAIKALLIDLMRPTANQGLLGDQDFSALFNRIGTVRQNFISPLGGERAVALLAGETDAQTGKEELDFVNRMQQQAWDAMTPSQRQRYLQLHVADFAAGQLSVEQPPAGFNAFAATELIVRDNNRVMMPGAEAQLDSSLAGEALFDENAYPMQGLQHPSSYSDGAAANRASGSSAALAGAGTALSAVANKGAEILGGSALKAALAASGVGAGVAAALKTAEELPIVGEFIKKFEEQIGKIILAIFGALAALAAFIGMLAGMLLSKALSAIGFGGKAASSLLGQADFAAGARAATSAVRGLGSQAGLQLFGGSGQRAASTANQANLAAQSKGVGLKSGLATKPGLLQTLATSPATVSVGGSLIMVAAGTWFIVTAQNAAFIADVPNAPIGVAGTTTSKYVELTKTANPKQLANNESADITYTINIAPRGSYQVTISDIKDTWAYLGGDALSLPDQTEAVKQQLQTQLGEGQALATPITITYTVPNVAGVDVMLVNNVEIKFSATDPDTGESVTDETFSVSAQVIIGNPKVGCFEFAPKGYNFRNYDGANLVSLDWSEKDKNQIIQAFTRHAGTSPMYVSKLCSAGNIVLFRLPGMSYGGGYAPIISYGGSNQKVVGLYDLAFGSIRGTEYTLIHEMGHILDYRNSGLRQNFMSIKTDDSWFTYPYAGSGNVSYPSEAFAEAIVDYVVWSFYPFKVKGGKPWTTFPKEYETEYLWIKANIFGDVEFNQE